jgi:hypothetical protein
VFSVSGDEKIFAEENQNDTSSRAARRRCRLFDNADFVRHFFTRMRALQNCARRHPHLLIDSSVRVGAHISANVAGW